MLNDDYNKNLLNFDTLSYKSKKFSKKNYKLKPPSLCYQLFKMFKWEIISAGLIKMLYDILQFINPILLK